jgi:hypothetical protein
MLCVDMLTVMPNVMLNVVMVNFVMLNVIMLNVVMLNVVMLNVVTLLVINLTNSCKRVYFIEQQIFSEVATSRKKKVLSETSLAAKPEFNF